MAVIRSRRVRDAGMGGLVQQPAALGAHRQHPAGRSRGTLLRHAGTTCHGGVTQTKWPPTNPGRFSVPRDTSAMLGGEWVLDLVALGDHFGHLRLAVDGSS